MGMRAALLALLLALAVPAGALAASPRTSVPDVEDEVMCPVCGVPLNLAQAPQADREREYIRRLVEQGATKEEIKRRLVDQYGPSVLAAPPRRGFDWAAWLVPLGLGLLGLAAVGLTITRWRGRSPPALPTAEPLSTADARRLDDDLARRDA